MVAFESYSQFVQNAQVVLSGSRKLPAKCSENHLSEQCHVDEKPFWGMCGFNKENEQGFWRGKLGTQKAWETDPILGSRLQVIMSWPFAPSKHHAYDTWLSCSILPSPDGGAVEMSESILKSNWLRPDLMNSFVIVSFCLKFVHRLSCLVMISDDQW